MKEPRITIAIPVLNEEEDIRDTLEAICSQKIGADEIEILVLDGGSQDRTREIVNQVAGSDGRVRLLINPGRYQAAALNRALEEARGEFFIYALDPVSGTCSLQDERRLMPVEIS